MNNNKGFTLIEVAMVLLIGGILLLAATSALLNYIKQTQINTTKARIETIDEALQVFLNLNGRYPCVAPFNSLIDDAALGFETFPCSTATLAPGGRAPRTVRIGAVPVRSLNLPDDFIGDAWGSRFTYAVTEALAKDGTYNRAEGAIYIRDSNNNEVVSDPANGPGTAHYAIVSHGENKSGATDIGGAGGFLCPAGNLEEENCNGDAVFRYTLLKGTANNASQYDDLITFRATTAFGDQVPKGAVMPFNLAACPTGWVSFGAGDGRFIVGADGVTYALGATGGSENVSLANTEMALIVNLGNTLTPFAGLKVFAEPTGGTAAPHENRPPYIALLYCEKS